MMKTNTEVDIARLDVIFLSDYCFMKCAVWYAGVSPTERTNVC